MVAFYKEKGLISDILVVDDESDIRALIKGILNDEGLSVREAADSDETLKHIETRKPALVILDIWLSGSKMDGMQILQNICDRYPDLPVIMISGHGSIDAAVSAIKMGAYDFIEKPFKADRLILQVQHALDTAKLRRENEELKFKANADYKIIGKSCAMNQIRQIVERVAPTGSRVLIMGPSGSGKEIVARALHENSRRSKGAFVSVSCSVGSMEQLEVELFGTEHPIKALDGSSCTKRKIGALEQAHAGTLFFDEIGDMPLEVQNKLIKFLQDKTFVRVGGSTPVEVDVRIIASSSSDLQNAIQAGTMRQDLFYRLNVVPIDIPPLVERKEDIPVIAEYFLNHFAETSGTPVRTLGEDAMAALQSYDWAGNVRQLRNCMEWVLIMSQSDPAEPIRADALPPEITTNAPNVLKWERGGEIMKLPMREAREMFEREYLIAQVTRFGGNISRTSGFIGMERSALHRKLKLLGIGGNSAEPSTSEYEDLEVKVG